MIYLDNAATSWPKPDCVTQAMVHFMNKVGASPGRSGHRLALDAGRVVLTARENLATLFNVDDPGRVIFTKNVTEALNTTLFGLLQPGERVITSAGEHNSVMRPLRWLETNRLITVTVVPCDSQGILDLDALASALQQPTRVVVLTHASNVTGVINPLPAISQLVRAAGALLVIDAAQTAGVMPIDLTADDVDVLAFTGHKGLLGPTGTGGLVLGEDVPLRPLIFGGTGSESEHEFQPGFLPDQLESGTLNSVGIAGLMRSTQFLIETGVAQIRQHEEKLVARLLDGLSRINDVTVYGPSDAHERSSVVSFNIANRSPAQVGLRLDETYEIMCRVGLHCAPAAHRVVGTFSDGSVRFGLGYFNTPTEIDQAIHAVQAIAKR
ncbi:MAG: aminotransferase class V-fold PLP-dependent enzyme [Chloroflexota bacterium]